MGKDKDYEKYIQYNECENCVLNINKFGKCTGKNISTGCIAYIPVQEGKFLNYNEYLEYRKKSKIEK